MLKSLLFLFYDSEMCTLLYVRMPISLHLWHVWWFCLQEEYDTHDPKGPSSMVLPFLRKRSKIIEIVAARDIVFALAQSGVCAAFSRGSINIC